MTSHLGNAPLYTQVEAALASEISTATLPPGSQVPPEERLIERFGVSRTTIRKAIENLVARGLVEIRRGKGTFVAPPKLTQELTALTGFVEDMIAAGRCLPGSCGAPESWAPPCPSSPQRRPLPPSNRARV